MAHRLTKKRSRLQVSDISESAVLKPIQGNEGCSFDEPLAKPSRTSRACNPRRHDLIAGLRNNRTAHNKVYGVRVRELMACMDAM